MKWSKLYNPLMKWLLRSPLHGVVSKMYLLVTFTGRKSGTVYSTPVEYSARSAPKNAGDAASSTSTAVKLRPR